jgi:tetratricopeptide (TPR) repeat protein
LRFNSLVVSSTRDRDALEQAVVRGSELLKLGKIDQAQRAFRSALDIDPHDTRVLALLGLAHFRANELAEARPIYEQLVERAPTDASHRLNLGLVYLKLGDADRAIAALEASRALDPSQGRAVSYLGLAYARAGRYTEAYRAFLIAGQNDLAVEIEVNLTAAEKDRIHNQLGRTPHGPIVDTPAPVIARAPTPEPRTRPPNAPPRKSQPIPVVADSAPEISILREESGGASTGAAPPTSASAAPSTAPASGSA